MGFLKPATWQATKKDNNPVDRIQNSAVPGGFAI